MTNYPRKGSRLQGGISIVEMMVAMTIGLILLAGMVTYFVNASNNQRELQRSSQQIENGRYALDTLIQDIHLAGFYGPYIGYATPAALPDSCDTSVAAMKAALGLPIMVDMAASMGTAPVPATLCAAWLTAANLAPGSDLLTLRYADSAPVAPGATTSGTATYLQGSPVDVVIQTGGGTTSCTSDAVGNPATITRKCSIPPTADTCAATCTGGGSPAGDVREFHVQIYFVAPCSVPHGGGSICTGPLDDGGKPIPTLKRLELTAGGFNIVPIAEGVEYMKLEFGVDDTPTTTNANTGLIGDGVPDHYTIAPSVADLANTVTVRIDLLVRNPTESSGFTDTKMYRLGVDPNVPLNPQVTVGPFNDGYHRHVYTAETRVVNLAGRKENP